MTQTGGPIQDVEAGNIGPEPDVTYTVELRRSTDNALIKSYSGLSGITTQTFSALDIGGNTALRVRLFSERNGLTSWQTWTHDFGLI